MGVFCILNVFKYLDKVFKYRQVQAKSWENPTIKRNLKRRNSLLRNAIKKKNGSVTNLNEGSISKCQLYQIPMEKK